MIPVNALVLYKNKFAIVTEITDGKFVILLQDGSSVKVRDKDIELLHPGPVKKFSEIDVKAADEKAVREAWELFLIECESAQFSLKDLASLIFGGFTPASAIAAYSLLKDGLYFSGALDAIVPRSMDEITAEEAKRDGKQRETGERSAFLERLKKCYKNPAENKMLGEDARFIQDVEALALGRSAKSRAMKELGLGETSEDAHSLLLKTGFWDEKVNPHPSRYGLSLTGANVLPDPPAADDAQTQRRDLCHLVTLAIDNSWSNDPDDAVSIEKDPQGNTVLYVHIADVASSITFDSPAEREARDRGATLYIPEGPVRMLAEEALPVFALGFSEKSQALTFKMTLDKNCVIKSTEIFPSIVKVRRITYEEADLIMESAQPQEEAGVLNALLELAQSYFKRRISQGAINIELPDVYISLENGEPKVIPQIQYRCAFIVKECMIIAGEGAGTWASGKGLAFAYISQEVELQGKVPGGMAGSYQLRRCMRARVLSTKPGRHQGMGLDTYSQVTSPLRRYTDLLAHMQIRAFLRGGKPLSTDEVSARLGFSEAAAAAAVQAERASCSHWLMVYLSGKKDSVWEAVALEKKGNRWAVMIPSLALETQVSLQRDVAFNDKVQLTLKSVNIPRLEAVFIQNN